MEYRKIEKITLIYIIYSSLIYIMVGLFYISMVNFSTSLNMFVAGVTILLLFSNIMEIFTEKILQFRLFLILQILLTILLYLFTYEITGCIYYLFSVLIFMVMLYERAFICYIEILVIYVLLGFSQFYFLPDLALNKVIQEYIMFSLFGGIITLAMGTIMHYRALIVTLQQDRHRLDTVLTKTDRVNREYRQYLINVEADAIEGERKRLTREIHDIVGHSMINNISMLEMISSMLENREKKERIDHIIQTAHENATDGLERARELLYQFRGELRYTTVGLHAISQMVDVVRLATGMKIQEEYGNCNQSFGKKLDYVFYHIVEESLLNSFRHGKAASVTIHAQIVKDTLRLDIQDDGVGAVSFSEGIGLEGMKERVVDSSGELFAGNNAIGFFVSASFPLNMIS